MKSVKLFKTRWWLPLIVMGLMMTPFWTGSGQAAVTEQTKAAVAALAADNNWQAIADMAGADSELSAGLADILAQIAAADPQRAAAIAAGMAGVMPDRAAEFAGAIAAAVPSQATAIAGAVAAAVPERAIEIAVAVSLAFPDQAAAIAAAVALVLPDSEDAIAAAVNEATSSDRYERENPREGEPSYGQ